MKKLTSLLFIALLVTAHSNLLASGSVADAPEKIKSAKKAIITGADQTEKYLSYLKGSG